MKRILFLFLLSPFFLQAQQGLIVTTAGDSILIEYSKIRSVTAPTRTARAVIMYDLTYVKYDVTYSFGKIMQDADCHLIEFVDVATGKYTAVPTTSIDQVKKKRGADNGYLFSEIENARADVVYEFQQSFTSMKDYLVQCAEDLGGPFEGVYTEFSVVGVGLEDSKIKLSGDLESPGNWMYYGTDGAGTKGWYSSSSVIDTAYFLGDTLYLILPGGDTISTFIETIEYLNDLGDVDTIGIGVNEFLMWDGANWVPQAVPTPYLNTLPDVDTADIQVDDIAQWDGSNWVMTSPVELIGDGGGAYGSGLAGRTAYWLDDSTLVHTDITYSSTELNASALTGSFQWPTGTTAQQPVGVNGKTRFNSTTGLFEGYHNAAYRPFATFNGTMTSGRIPYWNGTNLVSSSSFTYSTPGLRVSNNSASTEALGVTASNTVNGIAARFIADDVGIDGIGTNGVGGAFSGSQANIYLGLTSSLGGNAKNAIWFGNRPTPYQTDYTHHSFSGIDSRVGLYWEFRQGGHPSICARGLTNLTYDAGTLRMRVYESLCDTIVTGYEFRARRGLSTPVQFEIKNGELHGAFYGDNTITGTPSTWAAWDSNGKFIETTAADIVAAAGGGSSIYNLLPTQDILIDPNANDLVIGSFGAGNSGDFEFFTTNENGQYVGIFAGTRDSSWLATAGDGFQFDAALFSTGAEDGIMGVGYNYFGTVWNAAVFGDSILFAPYPGSELNMTINGLPDDPVNPYKVMVQDTVTDRVYLTSIDSLLGSGTAGTLPIWNADGTLGNSSLTEASGVLSSSLTGAFKLPAGTDAQDPVWAAGMLRYNTTANGLQGYDGTAERYLPWASAPTYTSGSVMIHNGTTITQDNFGLFFDAANNILRVNHTSGQTEKLQVNGGLRVRNNDGAQGGGLYLDPTRTNALAVVANWSGLRHLDFYTNDNGTSAFRFFRGGTSYHFAEFNSVDKLRVDQVMTFSTASGNLLTIRGRDVPGFKAGSILVRAGDTDALQNYGGDITITAGGYTTTGGVNSLGFPGYITMNVFRDNSTSIVNAIHIPGVDSLWTVSRVGIAGVTSPSVELDVNGRGRFRGNGTGSATGTHAYSASFTSSGTLIDVPEKWGAISTSTDGSGDIVVAHGMVVTPTSVQITVTGTTPYVVTVHTIDATNFTVRFYDMTGAAVTSTAVTATWHCKT